LRKNSRSGGVWEIKIEYRLDLVSTPAAADWDASVTAKSINLGKNTAKGSQRKCEFDHIREVPFI